MQTAVVPIDPREPDQATLEAAGAVIRAGGLVAFPTETVYGLGADALNGAAVAGIFAAKGRPATNPVIVHVSDMGMVETLAADWPECARLLAQRFWPGPLTIVVPRLPVVPDQVTAAGPTVALRMPNHPVALGLVRAAGRPVAAPSANASGRLSPTRAQHVLGQLSGRIGMVLDGGLTPGGLESTVVDLAGSTPRLLRPGLISAAMITEVLGLGLLGPSSSGGPLRSPGLLTRHYAPDTPLVMVASVQDAVERLAEGSGRCAVLARSPSPEGIDADLWFVLPPDPVGYAGGLYDQLHRIDSARLDCLYIVAPPGGSAWDAVRDRLARACAAG